MDRRTWLGLAGVLCVGVACGGDESDDGSTRAATSGSGASMSTPVNDCTPGMAENLTANAAVSVPWTLPHQRCITVAVGATVTWEGDFGAHPLRGGETGELDESNPITSGDPAEPPPTVAITLN